LSSIAWSSGAATEYWLNEPRTSKIFAARSWITTGSGNPSDMVNHWGKPGGTEMIALERVLFEVLALASFSVITAVVLLH
jgi:hypothetical protein